MRLRDKVAVITGAAHGIGRATALRFAAEGARVMVADIDGEAAEAVGREIDGAGGVAHVQVTDVAVTVDVEALAARTLELHGTIDVLVNNAGILRDARLEKLTDDDLDEVLDVNLKGVIRCGRAVTPAMIEQGSGVILNASSVVARHGNYGQSNYVAAKSGVIGITQVWARELGRHGIRVNAVAPGFIETRMVESIPEKIRAEMLRRVPLGRLGSDDEVASAYSWLASDEASYIHGHVLAVDGGAVV